MTEERLKEIEEKFTGFDLVPEPHVDPDEIRELIAEVRKLYRERNAAFDEVIRKTNELTLIKGEDINEAIKLVASPPSSASNI